MTLMEKTHESLDPFDLTVLTAGDKLWLWRHRQPSLRVDETGRGHGSLKQRDAAKRLGLFPSEYWRIENGFGTVLANNTALEAVLRADPSADLGSWTRGELCSLARHRARMNIAAVAGKLGYSKPMYYRFEAAADPRVVQLWENEGFRFP